MSEDWLRLSRAVVAVDGVDEMHVAPHQGNAVPVYGFGLPVRDA